jgi:exonuclease SbcD
MTEDQAFILEEMMALIVKESVDVLIIAGDLYDRSVPPTHAVELVNQTLTKIVQELKVKVIIIAGNHDSPDRLDFAASLLKDQGLYIVGQLQPKIPVIELEDDFGKINFFPIPYADPAIVKAVYDQACSDHESSVQVILNTLKLNPQERNVCISHHFVTGTEIPETSDSERTLSIGGTDQVSVDLFKAFDYVALGHLHQPQKVKYDHIRYGGSLLKYSFSEATQKKSVTLVTMDGKNDITIELKSLNVRRDMRVIKGKLSDLLSEQVDSAMREDYISALLTDEGTNFEPMKRLKALYPNILQIEKPRRVEEKKEQIKSLKSLSPMELINAFYQEVYASELNDQQEDLYQTIYNEVLKDERGKE